MTACLLTNAVQAALHGYTNIADSLLWPPGEAVWIVNNQPLPQSLYLAGAIPNRDEPVRLHPGMLAVGYAYPVPVYWTNLAASVTYGAPGNSVYSWSDIRLQYEATVYSPFLRRWGFNLKTAAGGPFVLRTSESGPGFVPATVTDPLPYEPVDTQALAQLEGALPEFRGLYFGQRGILRVEWQSAGDTPTLLTSTDDLVASSTVIHDVISGDSFPQFIANAQAYQAGRFFEVLASTNLPHSLRSRIGYHRREIYSSYDPMPQPDLPQGWSAVNQFVRLKSHDPQTFGEILEGQFTASDREARADQILIFNHTTGNYDTYWKHLSGLWFASGTGPTNTVPPHRPADCVASFNAFTQAVRVVWSASPLANAYFVRRAESNDFQAAASLATTTTTLYDDTQTLADKTYYYWVSASNTAGTSAFTRAAAGRRINTVPQRVVSGSGTTLIAAVSNAVNGELILIENGIYDVGATGLVVDKPVVIKSLNGPGLVDIVGPVLMTADFVRLEGVTVRDSASQPGITISFGSTAKHCVVQNCSNNVQNFASGSGLGGGVLCKYGGDLIDCTIRDNSARLGGGVFMYLGGKLTNCEVYGNNATSNAGGIFMGGRSVVEGCMVVSNTAASRAGGVFMLSQGLLDSSVIAYNQAGAEGGGVFTDAGQPIRECILLGNTAAQGGGLYSQRGGSVRNSVLYHNVAALGTNYASDAGHTPPTFLACCLSPLPSAESGIDTPPLLRDPFAGDFRPTSDSHCIDAGITTDDLRQGVDLDGEPRIFNGRVDIGPYEFNISTRVSALLGGSTSDALRAQHLVPAVAPYAGDPRHVESLPTGIVDWVHISLMRTQDWSTVSSYSAFLQAGTPTHTAGQSIIDSAGRSDLSIDVHPGHYWLSLQHRNHLSLVSAQPVAFTNTLVLFDFAYPRTAVLGASSSTVSRSLGRGAMIPGDADGDGRVTDVDVVIVSNQLDRLGYLSGDLDLDGHVTVQDVP